MTVNADCGYWLFALQTFPFPIQEPFWWWKDTYGNLGYIGVRFHTLYEFHPFDWGVFQGAWPYDAWAFLFLKFSSFFSCSRTDRILPHSCICCVDALYPAPCNAGIYARRAFDTFSKELHVRRKMHVAFITCSISHIHVKVLKIRFPVWGKHFLKGINVKCYFITDSTDNLVVGIGRDGAIMMSQNNW